MIVFHISVISVILLAVAVLWFLGGVIYLYAREFWYRKHCPKCRKRNGCWRNYLKGCSKGGFVCGE